MHVKAGRLIARSLLGTVFVAHGVQKLFGWFDGPGLDGFTEMMEKTNMHPPRRNAIAAGVAETAGGAALAAGALTPLAATSLIATMLVAIRKVHLENGFFATKGGYEFNLALIGGVVALVDGGPGPASVDAKLGIDDTGSAWALATLGAGAAAAALAMEAGKRGAAA
jgi:putative oxidoreductase